MKGKDGSAQLLELDSLMVLRMVLNGKRGLIAELGELD